MNAFFRTLPGVFEAIESLDEVRTAFVFAAWRHIAGEQIRMRTAPFELEGRRLIVAVPDKTWQRNLESLARQLVFGLNTALGRSLVHRIEFHIEPSVISSKRTADDNDLERSWAVPPKELVKAAAGIRDEHLRTTVLNAAANCLERKAAA